MWITPLEQFKIIVFIPIVLLGYDVSITNVSVYLLILVFFIFVLFKEEKTMIRLIPHGIQSLGEIMFEFVHDLVKQQAGIRGLLYLPIIFVLFYYILFLNLLGLTPFAFTVTSQMCNTFTLGFSMFIGVVILGIKIQKLNLLKQFVPQMTGPILPLLIIIEVFSYIIRPFSLSIRLFANMLAGHTLLNILSSFGISMLKIDIIVALFMAGPIVAISVLEFGIAFLQAYVFTVLICIYLKESLYGH